MKIRIYDKFDYNFTCAIYDKVEFVDDKIYFMDDTEAEFDSEFTDWEEIKEG